jgi:hypothetical protein
VVAVLTHGGKNWGATAALVPRRTKLQCSDKWHGNLDPSVTPTTERAGKWTAVAHSKLKDAVQTRGGKNVDAVAALVPERTICLQTPFGWSGSQRH